MIFSDIHIHALYGVDDGAKTEEEMEAMIDAAYGEGIRILCLTPHFHPGYFGYNRERSDAAFQCLVKYAEKKYPDLHLYRGNELRYSTDCLSWLRSRLCYTLGGSRFVLIDFIENESINTIMSALRQMLNTGYVPVLAHAERYSKLHGDLREIRELRRNGVLIQIDAASPLGDFGVGARKRCKAILAAHMADIVSSDAHNMTDRPPAVMAKCYEMIVARYGIQYANEICYENAFRILNGNKDKKGEKEG